MIEKIVELFFTEVNEDNKRKTIGAVTITYRAILLGICAVMFVNQQHNADRLDLINANLVSLKYANESMLEYRATDMREHGELKADVRSLTNTINDLKIYGTPPSDKRLTVLEKKVLGYSSSDR